LVKAQGEGAKGTTAWKKAMHPQAFFEGSVPSGSPKQPALLRLPEYLVFNIRYILPEKKSLQPIFAAETFRRILRIFRAFSP